MRIGGKVTGIGAGFARARARIERLVMARREEVERRRRGSVSSSPLAGEPAPATGNEISGGREVRHG
jgi:hypothetical protein